MAQRPRTAPARRPAAKKMTRPVKAAAPAPTAAKPKAAAPAAPKKRVRLVRDGFTMPEADFALIAVLKARALKAQREAKKSELLRAGLQALAALDERNLVAALGRLEPVKTGRPKKGH
jgi:hypothetical protein